MLTLFFPKDPQDPLDVFKTTPKLLSLSGRNFVTLSIYHTDAFQEKFQLNDIAASNDDVITKNDGANFTVNPCKNRKK